MTSSFLFPVSAFNVGLKNIFTKINSPQDLLFNTPNYKNFESIYKTILNNAGKNVPGKNVPSFDSGLGANLDTAKLALSGLGTIGNLWAAFEAQKLAQKQFDFTKRITETNLANQVQSYNTTLEDRGRSRAFAEGQSAADAQSYIDKNRLTTGG